MITRKTTPLIRTSDNLKFSMKVNICKIHPEFITVFEMEKK